MKKRFHPQWFAIGLTLLLAVAGFLLRRRQLATELLSDGSLAPGSRLHIYLIVLVFLLVAGLTALLLPLKNRTTCQQVFPPLLLPNLLQIVSTLGLICGNILLWVQGRVPTTAYAAQSPGVADAMTAILPPLGLASAVCIAVFAILRVSDKKPSALLYMLASVYLALRLIVCFQEWTVDPSIHDYCFQLFAAICCMLGTFQLGGFCLGRGKRRMCLFWTLSAVVFYSITLADILARGALDELLITLSLLLFMAISSLQLLFAPADA